METTQWGRVIFEFKWSEVLPASLGQWRLYPLFLFLPCFDTLIFTICPVRPITRVLHFYTSVVWAKSAAAVRQLFPLCLGSHVQPNRLVSETRNPRAKPTNSISIFWQSAAKNWSNLHFFSSDILFFFIEWHLDMNESKQIGWIKWLENYLFMITNVVMSGIILWILILKRFFKVEHRCKRKEHELCALSVVACLCLQWYSSLYKLPFRVEIHQGKETVVCRVPLPYLEVLDQFLDLPVFRGQVCVTLWTALWLLLLLFTFRWTCAESVHWHCSCWGLTEQKRAD